MRRFRDIAPAAAMPRGWLIGVLIHTGREPKPTRHFYAVGLEDRARAEWAALDHAITIGEIAASPFGGMEPVEAMLQLPPSTIDWSGLNQGEVRVLGIKWPRRWLRTETLT